MKYYQHHIGDFDRSTRHLTRTERSVYRDLLEQYYSTEQQLPLDLPTLCRKIIARSDEEIAAVEQTLNEFFTKTPMGWYHSRCEDEIEHYRSNTSQKAQAGKASAAARATKKQQALNTRSTCDETSVEQTLNGASTNRKPETVNHQPVKDISSGLRPDASTAQNKKFHDTAKDHEAVKWMFERVKVVNATAKAPNWNSWASAMRLMREQDGRTHREACELFQWANKDSFWATNIQSPTKLREKWDQLVMQMRRAKTAKPSPHVIASAEDFAGKPPVSDGAGRALDTPSINFEASGIF